MLKFSPNSTGMLNLYNFLVNSRNRCTSCKLPEIYSIHADEYSADSAEELFPKVLFNNIDPKRLLYFNIINGTTGNISGVMCGKIEDGETISEALFRHLENIKNWNNSPLSGVIIRYNDTNVPEGLKFIPFAVIE